MEYFLTLQDKDIYPVEEKDSTEYFIRPTAKGFVLDNQNNICLISINEFYGLPGGGIEPGETPEEAFVRECKEEIGCDVKIEKEIGVTLQIRDETQKKYKIYYFVARVVGEKGDPITTQDDEIGLLFGWHSIEETGRLLEDQVERISIIEERKTDKQSSNYSMNFNVRTHLAAFKIL